MPFLFRLFFCPDGAADPGPTARDEVPVAEDDPAAVLVVVVIGLVEDDAVAAAPPDGAVVLILDFRREDVDAVLALGTDTDGTVASLDDSGVSASWTAGAMVFVKG